MIFIDSNGQIGYLSFTRARSGKPAYRGNGMLLDNMKIGFIGGGNMAEALIKGLLAGGIPACQIHVAEPVQARRDFLQ